MFSWNNKKQFLRCFTQKEILQKLHFMLLNIGRAFVLQYPHLPLGPATGICATNGVDEDLFPAVDWIRLRFWAEK